METAIVSLICIAVILSGGLGLVQSAVLSADHISVEWKKMETHSTNIANTAISAQSVVNKGNAGFNVDVKNTGQKVLGNFPFWDVEVQYYQANGTYYIMYLPYVAGTSAGSNQWAVNAIQWNGGPEVYDPGMLDPGEDLIINIKPNPTVGPGKTILVVVSTDEGVTTSIQFTN